MVWILGIPLWKGLLLGGTRIRIQQFTISWKHSSLLKTQVQVHLYIWGQPECPKKRTWVSSSPCRRGDLSWRWKQVKTAEDALRIWWKKLRIFSVEKAEQKTHAMQRNFAGNFSPTASNTGRQSPTDGERVFGFSLKRHCFIAIAALEQKSSWWFQIFSPLLGEDFQFDEYFSDGWEKTTN